MLIFGGGETILIVFNGLLWWPGGLQCHDPSYLYIKRNINWIDLCCLPVHCPPAVATSSCIDRWSILKPWDTILITYKLAGTETCMEWDKIIRTREFKTCTGLNLKPGPGPGPSQDQELRPVSGPGPPEKAKARAGLCFEAIRSTCPLIDLETWFCCLNIIFRHGGSNGSNFETTRSSVSTQISPRHFG